MAANWSLNEVLAQLDSGSRWSGSTISYAFPTTSSGLLNQGEGTGFRPVNANQQTLMTLAMATWDELIPQGFAPGAEGSTAIEFGYTSTGIGYAHAYQPTVGSVYFNATEDSLVNTAVGEYGFQTFMHEIGHALGLNHMGNYNGNGNWTPSSYQDSVVLSVMSYFGPRNAAPNYSAEVMQADWVGSDGRIHAPQTPMVNDILAIQAIYGSSTTTRTEDTVYGFNSSAGGVNGGSYDFRLNTFPVLTLFDSGGNDTLDLSGWSSPSRVDLQPGAYSSANEMANNLAVAYGTTIENAAGGAGNDVIAGNSAANRLQGNGGNDELNGLDGDDEVDGGAGNDLIDGGAGSDSAVFSGNFSSYTITLTGNSVTLTSAASGSDRVVGVEQFRFADTSRTLAELAGGGSTDTAAPQLQNLSPVDDSGTVASGANLVLGFNEAVKVGSGSVTIFNADGSVLHSIGVSDGTQVSVNGASVTIDPTVNLVAGRSYFVNWSAGAFTDLAGNRHGGLSGSTSWNFATTATDSTAPQVLSLSPSDDAGAVAAGANLVLQFNEPVLVGSGSVVIRAAGQVLRTIALGDGSQVTISGSTVTINPAVDLPAGAAIDVAVDAGALRDATGNAFAGVASGTGWNFSVASTVADDYPYSADTPGVVSVNGPVSGGVIELGSDRDLFSVQLAAGVAYSFTLERTTGGLGDPVLTLWNPSLQLAAEDDDSAGSGNSRIGFTPTVGGTYYLGVADYLTSGSGAYTVRAATLDSQAPAVVTRTPADDATQVAVDADLSLTFSEPVLAGGGLIRLLDAGGAVLREIPADSAAVHVSGSSVTIDPGANLPAAASFSVTMDSSAFRDAAGNAVAAISSSTGWNFSTAAVSANDDFPLQVSTPGVLQVNGRATAGVINYVDDGDLFRVALTAGVTYRFDLVSPFDSLVDPYLMLFGVQPEVGLIGYDDDGGPLPLDSLLHFTPSESGEYYLAAYDYREATGRYSLAASATADDYVGSSATNGRVVVGGGASVGSIDAPSDVDMFAVTLTSGRQYSFELWSDGGDGLVDPYLALVDSRGNMLASDDDSGVDLESLLTYTASASGTFYLAAMDFDLGVGGYEVSGFVRNVLSGGSGDDDMNGTTGRDTLDAGAGNDRLRGAAGDDVLHGGDGIDLGRYAGSRSDYFFENMGGDSWVVSDQQGNEGRDLVYDVERLLFDDGYRAIDVDGHAGTTVKLLGAVFGPDSVRNEAFVGIGLTLLDQGWSESTLMEAALRVRLGADAYTPTNVVNLLFINLVNSLPDSATRLLFEGLINDGTFTMPSLALVASELDINLDNIGFTGFDGIFEHGIGYTL